MKRYTPDELAEALLMAAKFKGKGRMKPIRLIPLPPPPPRCPAPIRRAA
ncbi:MAG TPA: hypothetical protein PKO12_09735 [Holophaga sp.]|nr:hypothetical protein [Holophaga sp.]